MANLRPDMFIPPNLLRPAAPTNSAWAAPGEKYTFDHVPTLRELLPVHAGVPGFYYLQSSLHNLKKAESEGWLEVANTVTYTISGPSGSVDCKLLCMGARVPGSAYESGKRGCLVDHTIYELTGHTNTSAPQTATVAEEPTDASKSKSKEPSGKSKGLHHGRTGAGEAQGPSAD